MALDSSLAELEGLDEEYLRERTGRERAELLNQAWKVFGPVEHDPHVHAPLRAASFKDIESIVECMPAHRYGWAWKLKSRSSE